MTPYQQQEMIDKQVMLDGNGNEMKDKNGLAIGIPPEDVKKLKALKGFLDSLEPESQSTFIDSFASLVDNFDDKGAGDVLNYANTSNNFPQLDMLKRIYSTAGSLQGFAVAYEKLQETANYKGTDPTKLKAAKAAQDKIASTISAFKDETGASNSDIVKVFNYILNRYHFTLDIGRIK
jgi:hypothetical protein